jgi:hypothetical protein
MSTAARIYGNESSHWYTALGEPMHEVPRAKGGGTRATTLADARKLNLVPSVTNILKCVAKPGLEAWKKEQAVLAVLTTPRLKDESDDEYVERVLQTERVQDQETDIARARGTEMHAALEDLFAGRPISMDMRRWIEPAYRHLMSVIGDAKVETEITVVGDGYAGRIDLKAETDSLITLIDFKTCKTIPKEPYPEHDLQLAAYADAVWVRGGAGKRITTMNIYISTVKEGEFAIYRNPPWSDTYLLGFRPLVQFWQWQHNYSPSQPECSECNVPISPLDGGMCPACKANTSAECAA